jgi:hypothetical protein
MATIRRYGVFELGGESYGPVFAQVDNGDYVLYSDALAYASQVAREAVSKVLFPLVPQTDDEFAKVQELEDIKAKVLEAYTGEGK